ncbi:MAG TPA: ATP-binding SpoIIE family protein phosphatase, partial [Polyangiaceae bacterium]
MDWHQVQAVSDPSHPGEARRLAMRMASRRGLDDVDAGRVALVVTEASTNIVKHAGKGQILLRALCEDDNCYGVEVIALDRGPGMSDLARCFEDGYSTAGSPGTGLGAIRRLAPTVEIYSGIGLGTAMLAQVISRNTPTPGHDETWCVGSVRVPAPGETECGDDFATELSKSRAHIIVADGLGHGPEAAKAAAAAVRVFKARHDADPTQLLSEMHVALRSTRGAAVAYAIVDLANNSVQFTGVGNVAGIITWPGGSRH